MAKSKSVGANRKVEASKKDMTQDKKQGIKENSPKDKKIDRLLERSMGKNAGPMLRGRPSKKKAVK